jgi:hypothetical protein
MVSASEAALRNFSTCLKLSKEGGVSEEGGKKGKKRARAYTGLLLK